MFIDSITKIIDNKKVDFQVTGQAMVESKNFKDASNSITQNQQFASAVENFIKQNASEIKNLLSNYDRLIISLRSTKNTQLSIDHDDHTTNLDNEKIGKFFYSFDKFLEFSD